MDKKSEMKNRRPDWSFIVNQVSEIDFDRILNETPAYRNWVVVADKVGKPVVIFIRQSHLNKFDFGDGFIVAGENLHSKWGCKYYPRLLFSGNIIYPPSCREFEYKYIKSDWRASKSNDREYHEVTLKCIKTLEGSTSYFRRICVRVYCG